MKRIFSIIGSIVATVVIFAAILILLVSFTPKTIHQRNSDKLDVVIEKLDRLQDQFNSLTNQVFMLPVFPQEEISDITNNIMLLEHTIN